MHIVAWLYRTQCTELGEDSKGIKNKTKQKTVQKTTTIVITAPSPQRDDGKIVRLFLLSFKIKINGWTRTGTSGSASKFAMLRSRK